MSTAYLLCGSGYGYLFEDYEQVCAELEQTLGGGEGQGGLAAAGHGAAKSWTFVSD